MIQFVPINMNLNIIIILHYNYLVQVKLSSIINSGIVKIEFSMKYKSYFSLWKNCGATK